MTGRSRIRSPVVAGIVGLFAGGLTILLLEWVGHRLFGTADLADPSTITTPMFASVLVAWVVGSAVAGAVGTYWARATTITVGLVLGLLLVAGAFSNLALAPHPAWMMISATVLMPTAAILAARIVARTMARAEG